MPSLGVERKWLNPAALRYRYYHTDAPRSTDSRTIGKPRQKYQPKQARTTAVASNYSKLPIAQLAETRDIILSHAR